MELLELALRYIDVVVWPVVVVVILVVFRGQFRNLLGRLSRAEGMGFSTEFEKATGELQDEASRRDNRPGQLELPLAELESNSLDPTTAAAAAANGTYYFAPESLKSLSLVQDIFTIYDTIVISFEDAPVPVGEGLMQTWLLGFASGHPDARMQFDGDDQWTLRHRI